MAPAPSYAEYQDASVNSYIYLLPVTPNAFNVASLVMYVVCTLGLAYYTFTFAGGPDSWALGLVFHLMVLLLAWVLNMIGGEMRRGDLDQDMLLLPS